MCTLCLEEGRAFIFLLRLVSPQRSSKTRNVTGVGSTEEPDVPVVVCCWQFTLPGEMSVMLKVDILLSNALNTRTFSSE